MKPHMHQTKTNGQSHSQQAAFNRPIFLLLMTLSCTVMGGVMSQMEFLAPRGAVEKNRESELREETTKAAFAGDSQLRLAQRSRGAITKKKSPQTGKKRTSRLPATSVKKGARDLRDRKRVKEAPLHVKIGRERVFLRPFVWCGTKPPPLRESAALWNAIQSFQRRGPKVGLRALERFVSLRPRSRWTPSIRANLAQHYRDHGFTTRALKHWKAAWADCWSATSGGGKHVGDQVIVGWTSMLCGLGRARELEKLFGECDQANRQVQMGELAQQFRRNREAWRALERYPEISYKCGNMALSRAAYELHGGSIDVQAIAGLPSPKTGFSLAALAGMAQSNRLDFVAVRRVSGAELMAPSVIHWKQNHYAAIVKKKGNLYQVIDPTFAQKKWLSAAALNEEASGYFMIPRSKLGPAWKQVDLAAAGQVFGKGNVVYIRDGYDCGPVDLDMTANPDGLASPQNPCSGPSCAPVPPACPCDAGMPIWSVSEPFLNLWLSDRPLGYQPPVGDRVDFRLRYKERDTRPQLTNVFNFGPLWNHSWLSYLRVVDEEGDPDFANYEAIRYIAGGGERAYAWDDSAPEAMGLTSLTRLTDAEGNLTGFRVDFPNGRQAIYGWLKLNLSGELLAFQTRRVDPQGRATVLEYEETDGNILLKRIIDAAGQTNTLSYADANFPAQVTGIRDPFGNEAALEYGALGELAQITDVVGMSSSFDYDAIGCVTALTTPYGQTSFQYREGQSTNGIVVQRGIDATLPNGAQQMVFLSRFNNRTENIEDPNSELLNLGGDNYLNCTVRFGPRQFANLSTNSPFYFTHADFRKGRIKVWKEEDAPGEIELPRASTALVAERQPSPDASGATEGQKTFYRYPDDYEAVAVLPSEIFYYLPNGQTNHTWIERNPLGRPTQVIRTWEDASGSLGYRTNWHEYAPNQIDLIKSIGPDGVTSETYGYNEHHQVIAHTNAVGYVTTYTYDDQRRLASTKRPTGLTITNVYDAQGRLTESVELEIGRTNKYTYTNGLVHTFENAAGLRVTYAWDALERLTSVAYPDGTYTSNAYHRLDLVGVRDRSGGWKRFAYNSARLMVAETNELGSVTQYGYCSCGSLESVTNALGEVTSFAYDNLGRRTSIIHPDLSVQTKTYDALGRIESEIDETGRRLIKHYNHQGLPVSLANDLGALIQLSYDINGWVTNRIDSNGYELLTEHDPLGRVLARHSPDGGSETFLYSARGLIARSNPLGQTARFGYDAAGRKTHETNANNEVLVIAHNPMGDVISRTDAKGQTTTWDYDEYGRVTNAVAPNGSVIARNEYGLDGQVTQRWTPAKGAVEFQYDAAGNLTQKSFETSPAAQYQYDALNRLVWMSDAVGVSQFAYDSRGNLMSEDGPWDADTVSYEYAANGLRKRLRVPGDGPDWEQHYHYDAGLRLESIESPAGEFGYRYTGAGAETPMGLLVGKVLLPGDSKIVNTYDLAGRLVNTKLLNLDAETLNLHAYVYNLAGQRAKQTFAEGNYLDYTYDDAGQVASVVGKEAGGWPERDQERVWFNYDAAGNLSYRTNHNLVHTFGVDANHQLQSLSRSGSATVSGRVSEAAEQVTVNGQPAAVYADRSFTRSDLSLVDGANVFTATAQNADSSASDQVVAHFSAASAFLYDANGNLVSDGQKGYDYDAENQLRLITKTNDWRSEFVYDGLRRRRIRREYEWDGGNWLLVKTVHYVYDGQSVVQERDGGNLAVISYTRGVGMLGQFTDSGGAGGLLARTVHEDGPDRHDYYHCDGSGNVTALVNGQGVKTASYSYSPFGRLLASEERFDVSNTYRFASKEYHPKARLSYYQYRYFSPDLGRWLNADPAGFAGGRNKHAFGGNDPINRIDLDGRWTDGVSQGVVAAQLLWMGLLFGTWPVNAPFLSAGIAANLANPYVSGPLVGVFTLAGLYFSSQLGLCSTKTKTYAGCLTCCKYYAAMGALSAVSAAMAATFGTLGTFAPFGIAGLILGSIMLAATLATAALALEEISSQEAICMGNCATTHPITKGSGTTPCNTSKSLFPVFSH